MVAIFTLFRVRVGGNIGILHNVSCGKICRKTYIFRADGKLIYGLARKHLILAPIIEMVSACRYRFHLYFVTLGMLGFIACRAVIQYVVYF